MLLLKKQKRALFQKSSLISLMETMIRLHCVSLGDLTLRAWCLQKEAKWTLKMALLSVQCLARRGPPFCTPAWESEWCPLLKGNLDSVRQRRQWSGPAREKSQCPIASPHSQGHEVQGQESPGRPVTLVSADWLRMARLNFLGLSFSRLLSISHWEWEGGYVWQCESVCDVWVYVCKWCVCLHVWLLVCVNESVYVCVEYIHGHVWFCKCACVYVCRCMIASESE